MQSTLSKGVIMANLAGASIAATGTISSNTASLLSLASTCGNVIVNNQSGQKCYVKVNDAATPTVSATVYDFVLADQGTFVLSHIQVTNVSVFVAATSGVRVVGWPG
jgi:hypothetical protein